MEVGKNKKHFVLVHGACHGAWCWYKVATLLTSAGNRVTAVDLAASGINPKKFEDEVLKFSEYSLPLLDIMASLPPQERVILVGHSLGGLNLALAMDKYPEKVSVAVFLTAFMPDSSNRPSYILDKDYTLATTLVRVGSLFQEDLSNAPFFSKERYGSVTRVFIVCDEDMAIPDEFQHWMVENNPVKEVKVINGSDHMPMFCKAQELCHSLLEIAERHA
ncbi:methylesterase 1-like isoform X3 [Magnolia sinica]|uniref:methylesterase 1-like isoform X3 n=1 Tax=Magnolia sinica TaxID=86752 RepID=UPI00265936D7|nr:methylesterase 1-like isoform X3 [Magnolia sinica]